MARPEAVKGPKPEGKLDEELPEEDPRTLCWHLDGSYIVPQLANRPERAAPLAVSAAMRGKELAKKWGWRPSARQRPLRLTGAIALCFVKSVNAESAGLPTGRARQGSTADGDNAKAYEGRR